MIDVTDHGGVAVLRLNHGPVNALDLELLSALPDTLTAVAGAWVDVGSPAPGGASPPAWTSNASSRAVRPMSPSSCPH